MEIHEKKKKITKQKRKYEEIWKVEKSIKSYKGQGLQGKQKKNTVIKKTDIGELRFHIYSAIFIFIIGTNTTIKHSKL